MSRSFLILAVAMLLAAAVVGADAGADPGKAGPPPAAGEVRAPGAERAPSSKMVCPDGRCAVAPTSKLGDGPPAPACKAPATQCGFDPAGGAVCVDLRADADNCGRCGCRCAAGCVNGQCADPSGAGLGRCDDQGSG